MGKRVLITGAGSYVGTGFADWLASSSGGHTADTVATLGGEWERKDFAGYDAVLHVAAVVHTKEKQGMAGLYREVNTELAIKVARKAKEAGVRQFVFMSTMAVYGMETGAIMPDTAPKPDTLYGKSKLDAEEGIAALTGDGFAVAILRPPMVYGHGCPGNYPRLSALVKKLPVFPDVANERSMLYIGHLCAFLGQAIEQGLSGTFFPQNREYVRTSELAGIIRSLHGKPARLSRPLGRVAGIMPGGVFRKVFGSLTYDKSMSGDFSYCTMDFAETIKRTEAVN
jgi:UDP-glucose 4-epimerase